MENPKSNGDKQVKWTDHEVRGRHQETLRRENIDNSENKGKEEGRTSLR